MERRLVTALRLALSVGVLMGVLVLHAARARGEATAAPDRVVLVGGDAPLGAAVEAALAPTGAGVVQVSGKLAPRGGSATDGARKLAERHDASGTVWLVVAGDRESTTLYVYDRREDRVLVRTLPYAPPLDDAQNAEVARSARTMLRALRGLPDTMSPVATAEPEPKPDPVTTPEPEAKPDPVTTPEPGGWLAVQGAVGVRVPSSGDASLEARLDVSLRLGLVRIALIGDYAGSSELSGPFKGEASERAIAVCGRVVWRLGSRFELVPGVGFAGHAITASGSGPRGVTIDESLFVPALRGEVGALFRFAPAVAAGVLMSLDVGLGDATVTADGREAYSASTVRGFVGVSLILGTL